MRRVFSIVLVLCLLASCLTVMPAFSAGDETLPQGRVLGEEWQELTEERKTFDDAASGMTFSDASFKTEYQNGAYTITCITPKATYPGWNFKNTYTEGKYYMELAARHKVTGGDAVRGLIGTAAADSKQQPFNLIFKPAGISGTKGSGWSKDVAVDDVSGTWYNLGIEVDLTAKTYQLYINGEPDTINGAMEFKNSENVKLGKWNLYLKSTFLKDDYIAFSDFRMWRYEEIQEPTDEEKLSADKAALTWNAIKGENAEQSAVTENLYLPDTIGTNNTQVTWSSDSTAVAVSGTVGTVTRPKDKDAGVKLTANLTNGTAQDSINFSLTVKKAEEAVEEPLPDGRELDANWKELEGEHKTFDNASSGINHAGTAELGLTYQDGALTIGAKADVPNNNATINMMLKQNYTSGKYYMELLLKQSFSGEGIRTFVGGNRSNNNCGLMLTHGAADIGYKYNADGQWGTGISYEKGQWLRLGVELDIDSDTAALYLNGKLSGKGAVHVNAEDVSKLDAWGFNFRNGMKQNDYITLGDFKMWKYEETPPELTDEQKLAADKTALTWDAVKGENAEQSAVTENLYLPDTIGTNGTQAVWSSDNDAVAVSGNTGRVTRPQDKDAGVKLTANLTNGTAKDFVEFNLTVKRLERVLVESENLALNKTVTGSAEVYNANSYGYDKMVDGNAGTRVALKDRVPLAEGGDWIQIDLGEETQFNKITMTEFQHRMTRWKFLYSSDGEKWQEIGEYTQEGNNGDPNSHQAVVLDQDVTARYVRLLLLEKWNEMGVSIYEMGIYRLYEPTTTEEKLNYVMNLLTDELILNGQSGSAVISDLYLPASVPGLDNNSIAWGAVPSGMIDLATGKVTRRAADIDVTLTAVVTVDGVSRKKEFTLTVAGESADNTAIPTKRKGWTETASIAFDQANETAGRYTASVRDENIVKSFDGEGYLNFSVTNTVQNRDSYMNDYLTIPFPESYTTGKHYAQTTFKANLSGDDGDVIRMYIGNKVGNADYAILPIIGKALSVGKASLGDQKNTFISGKGPKDQAYTMNEWHTFGVEFDCDAKTVRFYLDEKEIFTERNAGYQGKPIEFGQDNPMTSWSWGFYKNLFAGHTITFKDFSFWSLDLKDFNSDLNKLTYEMLTSESPEQITKDLTLPAKFEHQSGDVTISWSASDETVISADGKIHPDPVCDRTVQLTALLEQASTGMSAVKSFSFTVQRQDSQSYVYVEQESFESADALKDALVTGDAGISGGALTLAGSPETSAQLVLGAEGLRLTGTQVQIDLALRVEELGLDSGFAVLDSAGAPLFEGALTGGSYTIADAAGKELTFYYQEDASLTVVMNTETKTAAVYLNGKKQGDIVLGGTNISTAVFSAKGKGNLFVDSLTLAVKSENPDAVRVQLDKEMFQESDMTDEPMEYITKDLKLSAVTAGMTGSAITWSSDKPEVIGSTGVVTRPEEDTRVTITAAFHSGTETQTKAFVFTVKGTKHADLAYGGTASATTEQEGGEARNLTDGRADTGWLAAEEDEAPSVTLVLPETQKITKVLLRETGGLVQGFTLEISEDNKTWKTVHTGAAVGPEKEITFTVVKARYVRYTVTQKAAGATGLSAFEVRYEKSDYERVAADMESLKLEKSQDGTRYLLPKSGLNGSTITWKSSDPERIDPDTGLITRGGSAVRVVLTAMVTYGQAGDEKKWSVEVPGKGGTGGGGGGSSGGGGGVNLGGSTIVSPDQNQPENPVHPVKPDGMPFRDVPKESWSYDYIQRVQKAGIVSGDGSGNFYPQNNVTREEFVKMLALALELEPAEEGEYPFRDVADGDWFAPYVRVAYDSGIVKGVTGNDFGVGAHISRQDMAVMIDRALEKTGRKLEEGNWAVFADAAEIADYAKESVGRLNAAGILVGSNGAFYPTDTLTREQAAKVIAMILDEAGRIDAE